MQEPGTRYMAFHKAVQRVSNAPANIPLDKEFLSFPKRTQMNDPEIKMKMKKRKKKLGK